MSDAHLHLPADPTSRERLAAFGLRYEVVASSDRDAYTGWFRADARGFHDAEPAAEVLAQELEGLAFRRTVGIFDDTIVDRGAPVATVSSWPMQLTVPGRRDVTAWAISSVTVSATHRRRGIARNMLEGELRTARELGIPLAMLTVSEATIYGRYGFGPANRQSPYEVDTKRVRWTGPVPEGRVHYVNRDDFVENGPAVAERQRLDVPGEVERWPMWWRRRAGLIEPDSEQSRRIRVARYDDASGTPQGFAVFHLADMDGFRGTVVVDHLLSATRDAEAALWRFLLEQDLVVKATADLRSPADPLPWYVDDVRGVRKTDERDHLWLRVLDPVASLEARTYAAAGRVALRVADALGFADGTVLLETDDRGAASASRVAEPPTGVPTLDVPIASLGSLLLGGVTAETLLRVGRVQEATPGAAVATDAVFRSPVVPFTSIWF
ncbi:putative acetyltransferase [Diaminobutyricimonas aerilata]|uniref:Putative acetyltransferase n=1 Tax=Diaminobutyricimonas aerilata TaxID=1162967 RepID=A0A2M9CK79_9MICO|nr:GNAT family N-acetyltransferase [Diaminobutyricimonas aerilata]PJJ72288.1 putative acetyltransferase [Diaminobutyricimonas aerilata]